MNSKRKKCEEKTGIKKRSRNCMCVGGMTEIVEEIIRQARKREKTNILISKGEKCPR